MAKVDKTFQWRMEGMHFAYQIAKEQGVDALLKEIKRRGLLRVDLAISQKRLDETWDDVKHVMLNNLMSCVMYSLWKEFGFGKIRLSRFKDSFDQYAQNAVNLDYLGEHYATLGEYAEELQKNHEIILDVDEIKRSQREIDAKNNYTGRCKLSRVLEILEINGFGEAAEFLKSNVHVKE